MGKFPVSRVNPTLPYQNVSIDVVGTFTINVTTNRQIKNKILILKYLCHVSKALHTKILDSITS